MSLRRNDATGSADHARGKEAGPDVASRLYAASVATGVVTTQDSKLDLNRDTHLLL